MKMGIKLVHTGILSSSSLESIGTIILDLFFTTFFATFFALASLRDSSDDDFGDSDISELDSVLSSTIISSSLSTFVFLFNFPFVLPFSGVSFTGSIFFFLLEALSGVLAFLFSFSLGVAGDNLIFGVP